MVKAFDSVSSRESFKVLNSQASSVVAFAAKAGLNFYRIFGERLGAVPVLKMLHGPTKALLAMTNTFAKRNNEPLSLPIPSPCEANEEVFSGTWDEVIIGSGPGAAVAYEAAIRDSRNALVIERGVAVNPFTEPHGLRQMSESFFRAGQEIVLTFPPTPFAQASAYGGGSEINSGLYHNLPEKIRKNWIEKTDLQEVDYVSAQEHVFKKLNIMTQDTSALGLYSESPLKQIGQSLNWEGGVIPRWRKYSGAKYTHFGAVNTYFKDVIAKNLLLGHNVTRLEIKPAHVLIKISGPNCKHQVRATLTTLSAGTTGTPELLVKSGLAKTGEFSFGFHAMVRVAAKFPRKVNDGHDIDPHQYWSPDGSYKIGAAVATPELLAATLATTNSEEKSGIENIVSYYISTPSEGKSGFLKLAGNLVPYLVPTKQYQLKLRKGYETLVNAIENSGGTVFGRGKFSVSSVHVFGSLPLGKSKIIDSHGFVRGTDGRIKVRDASLLPAHPTVNPQGPLMHFLTALEAHRKAT